MKKYRHVRLALRKQNTDQSAKKVSRGIFILSLSLEIEFSPQKMTYLAAFSAFCCSKGICLEIGNEIAGL